MWCSGRLYLDALLHVSLVKEQYEFQGNMLLVRLMFELKNNFLKNCQLENYCLKMLW